MPPASHLNSLLQRANSHAKHLVFSLLQRRRSLNRLVGYADRFGMTASALCLVHCLAMPLLLVPLFGLSHVDDGFHRAMVIAVTLPVLLALIPGYLTHRRWRVLALGVAGLIIFGAAVLVAGPLFGESAELLLAVISGLLLFGAHYRNRHHCLCCQHSAAEPAGVFSLAEKCNTVAKKICR
jgi:hypothetical protein